MNNHLKQIYDHAQAVRTKQREDVENAALLIAAPGVSVVVIRWPWAVGQRGRVMAVMGDHARIDFDGTSATLPLSAISRGDGLPDCASAHIQHVTAQIKLQAGEFLS